MERLYKDRSGDGQWSEAPHLSEEVYNLEDALVVAQWLNVFLRKSDVVRSRVWRKSSTRFPRSPPRGRLAQTCDLLSDHVVWPDGVSHALDVAVKAPRVETREFGDVPVLDVASSYNVETGTNAIFIVNRSQTDSVTVDVRWQALTPTRVTSAYQISGTDPKAVNTFENPELSWRAGSSHHPSATAQ